MVRLGRTDYDLPGRERVREQVEITPVRDREVCVQRESMTNRQRGGFVVYTMIWVMRPSGEAPFPHCSGDPTHGGH